MCTPVVQVLEKDLYKSEISSSVPKWETGNESLDFFQGKKAKDETLKALELYF